MVRRSGCLAFGITHTLVLGISPLFRWPDVRLFLCPSIGTPRFRFFRVSLFLFEGPNPKNPPKTLPPEEAPGGSGDVLLTAWQDPSTRLLLVAGDLRVARDQRRGVRNTPGGLMVLSEVQQKSRSPGWSNLQFTNSPDVWLKQIGFSWGISGLLVSKYVVQFKAKVCGHHKTGAFP